MSSATVSNMYRPLDAIKKEIRVISLHAANEVTDPLRCDIQHVSLADSDAAPKYEALSYTWGAPEFTEPIALNVVPSFITINLSEALRRLRGKFGDPPRILWVDAICINQEDLEERGSQVQLMREIYRRCTTDLAWLGIEPLKRKYYKYKYRDSMVLQKGRDPGHWPYHRHIEKGIKLMKKIQGHELSAIKTKHDEGLVGRYEADEDKPDESFDERLLSIQEEINYNGKRVLRLSRRQQRLLEAVFKDSGLLTRVWVMQELSCAPRVTLVGGNEELDWDVLSNFFGDRPYADAFHRTYRHHDDVEPIMQKLFVQQLRIEHQREAIKTSHPQDSSLLDVLVRFRDTESTDQRDKVYGLLGLIQDAHPIVPNYTEPFEKLYAEVTTAHINKTAALDLLCQNPFSRPKNFTYMELAELRKRALSLPSWVPEFSERRPNDILFAQRGIFNAGSATCETPAVVRDGMLQVKGIIMDHLGPVHKYWGGYYQPDQAQMARSYFGTIHVDRITTPYPHPPSKGNVKESVSHALARTLSRDCTEPPGMRRLNEDDIASRIEERNRYIVNKHSFWAPPLHAHSIYTITRGGLYVLVQQAARKGDVVAVVDGGKVPVILRPLEDKEAEEGVEKKYTLISVAYVHGYMDGEAAMEVDAGRLLKETFWLA